jgi:hypothetical protein
MTKIWYVSEEERNDETEAVTKLYEKPIAQPQFSCAKPGMASPSHTRGRTSQRERGFDHVRGNLDPVTGRNRVDPHIGVVPKCHTCGSDMHFVYEKKCELLHSIHLARSRAELGEEVGQIFV